MFNSQPLDKTDFPCLSNISLQLRRGTSSIKTKVKAESLIKERSGNIELIFVNEIGVYHLKI